MNAAQWLLIAALRCYRFIVSPIFDVVFTPMGFGCRFYPTCSRYALDAVRRHGAARGSMMAIKRVCRCHPWGGCGCDPVPDEAFNHKVGRGVPPSRFPMFDSAGTPRPTS